MATRRATTAAPTGSASKTPARSGKKTFGFAATFVSANLFGDGVSSYAYSCMFVARKANVIVFGAYKIALKFIYLF